MIVCHISLPNEALKYWCLTLKKKKKEAKCVLVCGTFCMSLNHLDSELFRLSSDFSLTLFINF